MSQTTPGSNADPIHPTQAELIAALLTISDEAVRKSVSVVAGILLLQRDVAVEAIRSATEALHESNQKWSDASLTLNALGFELHALRKERDDARKLLDSHGIKWQK